MPFTGLVIITVLEGIHRESSYLHLQCSACSNRDRSVIATRRDDNVRGVAESRPAGIAEGWY